MHIIYSCFSSYIFDYSVYIFNYSVCIIVCVSTYDVYISHIQSFIVQFSPCAAYFPIDTYSSLGEQKVRCLFLMYVYTSYTYREILGKRHRTRKETSNLFPMYLLLFIIWIIRIYRKILERHRKETPEEIVWKMMKDTWGHT